MTLTHTLSLSLSLSLSHTYDECTAARGTGLFGAQTWRHVRCSLRFTILHVTLPLVWILAQRMGMRHGNQPHLRFAVARSLTRLDLWRLDLHFKMR